MTALPTLLRTVAILIAIVAVIDPALTSTRATRPEIAVVATDSPGELAAGIARELEERFVVIPAPFAAAAATVVVGNRLPASSAELASPVFAVGTTMDAPATIIEAVHAPARAAVDVWVAIVVATRSSGATGRAVEATLRMGDVVVDRATRPIASDDERHDVPLSFVPTAPGAVALRITATIVDRAAGATGGAGSGVPLARIPSIDMVAADIMLDVHDERRAVLFHDPRPSWLSTFVRRAVERDPRFVVTSRVITSRNVSTEAGRPPGTLADPATLSLFDVIVVGAPEALSDRDVAGLDAWLRQRGGSLVFLLDQRASGAYDRLVRVRDWRTATGSAGFVIAPTRGDSGGLRASAMAWPATLPWGAQVIAFGRASSQVGGESRPVIWRSAIGAGQVIVSGALDAWRFRDPAQSGFDAFWRTTIADASEAAPGAIEIDLASAVVEPGEHAELRVTLRDATLARLSTTRVVRASVSAAIETAEGPVSVRLWPEGLPGRFRGTFRAPSGEGIHRIVVTSDGLHVSAPFVVRPDAARPTPDESSIVAAWARAHGGASIAESRLAELGPALERAVQRPARRETWYPMRSAWWIVPFTLLLGAEWFWRRRRGLA